MANDGIIRIKPIFPFIHLLVTALFIALSIMFYLSPFRDWRMLVASIAFGSTSLAILWFLDYVFLTIEIYPEVVKFKGIFWIRRFELRVHEIEGYELHQKVDQFNGLHEEIQIVSRNGQYIVLPKVAYGNYDYIKNLFPTKFKFLGFKELKYGKLLGKLIPVIFLLSGIFASLIGLLKFFK